MATFITLTQMEARLRGEGPAPRRNPPTEQAAFAGEDISGTPLCSEEDILCRIPSSGKSFFSRILFPAAQEKIT